ncbi:MAG TPA: ABC transporter ATP-binding protein [Cytophagaceae bacterium]|nr:ABC transporter ATP-binding protein [Cytophagaceae bacterium]
MEAILIDIKNVHKGFKDIKAVNGINLTIRQGEFVGLLGPNGAGKTTLIEMIEGLQQPDSGEILVMGKSWKKNETALHRIIGISFQETKFMDKLSVKETLQMFASFYALDDSRVEQVLDLVNLQSKKKSHTVNLSGGQRQRLALGVALLHKPKVLLLDEPTTGLDPAARREVWNILEKLKREENTSMILTTHYMEEAEFLCDRIVIMNQGAFIAQGSLEELVTNYSEGEIIEFNLEQPLKEDPQTHIKGIKSIIWDIPLKRGKMNVDSISKTLPLFIQHLTDCHIAITELECRKMTLDDLFISMTGRRLHEN